MSSKNNTNLYGSVQKVGSSSSTGQGTSKSQNASSTNLSNANNISNTKQPPAEERFYTVLLQLANELNNVVKDMEEDNLSPVSSILTSMGVAFIESYENRKKMINKFIVKSYDHWNEIRNRNLAFFKESAGIIFDEIPVQGINDIFDKCLNTRNIKGELYVNEAKIKKIWSFFDSLINISISYLHDNAGPVSEVKDNKQTQYYTKNPFLNSGIEKYPKIDILKEAVKSDEFAKKNNTFKFSLKDRLCFPVQN